MTTLAKNEDSIIRSALLIEEDATAIAKLVEIKDQNADTEDNREQLPRFGCCGLRGSAPRKLQRLVQLWLYELLVFGLLIAAFLCYLDSLETDRRNRSHCALTAFHDGEKA